MTLHWIDDRWHCEGRPIHAGDQMDLRFPDGAWVPVRIESNNHGLNLCAFFDFHGETLALAINGDRQALRWPAEPGRRYQPS